EVDNYGKLWVATIDGSLSKFDGINEEVLIPPNSELIDGYIGEIAFDINNDIWFSTLLYLDDEEYSWFGCEESKLVKVEGLAVSDDPVWTFYDNNDLPGYYISEMDFDNAGTLWLTYSKGVLVKFDGNTFTEYNIFGPGSAGGWLSFTIDQDNIIWIGNIGGTLVKFDGTNAQVIEPGFPDTGQPRFDYHQFKSFAVDENNNLWLGTDVGLIKYNGSSWSYYELETEISSITISSDGRVWAGGLNGLYVYKSSDDPELYGSPEYSIRYYGPFNTGIPDDYISAIKTDSTGNTWIGTFDNGLVKFDGVSWTVFQAADTDLPDDQVSALTSDEDNNIWIGTRQGLAKLSALSLEGQSWHIYNTGNCELPANSIHCLHYYNGILWIGTSLGLTRFDGENWVSYNTGNSNLPDNDIRSIKTDIDGNIWIGTYGGGLCKITYLSLNEPDWEIFNTANSALPDDMIFALEEDSIGNIWIGTAFNGLVKYDGSDFTIYDTDNSELPDNHIQSLKMYDENNMWIGMLYGGVSVFDGTQWTNHGTVLEGAVYTIDVDRYGNKWIGFAGGGVAVYNEAGIASRNDLCLSGHLFLDGGDTPVDESIVELYPLGSTEYSEQLILSGTNAYAFTGQEYGQYTVKVIPDTLSYPETLPTWLGYKLTRADASYISLNKNISNGDITVIQRPDMGSGTGTVTGSLTEISNIKGTVIVLSSGEIKGTPLGDCYVYLLDPQDQAVKAFDITSADGKFTFSKLEAGEYVFFADYKGLHMNLSNPVLEIESNNDTLGIAAVAGVEDIVIQAEVISDVETILENNLKVYPVPVNNYLTVSYDGDKPYNNIENIRIIGLNGNILYENNTPLFKGSDIEIDLGHFAPGIYLLRIQGKDACRYIKIIKK
ncbi:MAG: two-component regulator propeller domain-containing protein, partial [Bacteroidota bacterium]